MIPSAPPRRPLAALPAAARAPKPAAARPAAPAAMTRAQAAPACPPDVDRAGLVRRAASTAGAFAGGVAGLVGMDAVLNVVAFSWTPPGAIVVAMVVASIGAGIAAGWTGAGALARRLGA